MSAESPTTARGWLHPAVQQRGRVQALSQGLGSQLNSQHHKLIQSFSAQKRALLTGRYPCFMAYKLLTSALVLPWQLKMPLGLRPLRSHWQFSCKIHQPLFVTGIPDAGFWFSNAGIISQGSTFKGHPLHSPLSISRPVSAVCSLLGSDFSTKLYAHLLRINFWGHLQPKSK